MKPFTANLKIDNEDSITVRVVAVDSALDYAMCLDLDNDESDVMVVPISRLYVFAEIVDGETAEPE
ncbi:MAG: hypothetical protein AAF642_01160 [Pseudomonadota bacterium]